MSKKKKLVFIAVVWFLLANILFSIFGRALAPSGGIDSIGAMLIYVFLWRTFIKSPPENPRALGPWDEWRVKYILPE